jgi:DNA processing protein
MRELASPSPDADLDLAYVALALVPGIGRVRLEALLDAFGAADHVLIATVPDLKRVPGITRAAAHAIKSARIEFGAEIVERARTVGGTVLTPSAPGFPSRLKCIPTAPTLLFAAGRLELLEEPSVSIVGSRDHTRYGYDVCTRLAADLAAAGLTVVSGMARGLDAAAHQGALGVGGNTVGVLGNGLGIVYPSANARLYELVSTAGCLLTELPPGERPNAGSFPSRNRLISGLSRVTVVVEARKGSGALITADFALAQGRELMAVPGPITSGVSVGTNRLVQMGAKPVLDARDVLEEYGIDATIPQVSLPSDLSDGERRVLDLLDEGLGHIDELAARIDGGISTILPVITSLEIRGLVAQGPRMVFSRRRPSSLDT